MNPCPCGFPGSKIRERSCTPPMIGRYRGRVSGPLMDRIDLHVEVPAVPYSDISMEQTGEGSHAIRRRVIASRGR